MKPEQVNPQKFKDIQIVYTSPDEYFTIASGIGDGGNEYQPPKRRYAFRWNGHSDTQKGFPTSNGYPLWFQLPTEIDENIIESIIASFERKKEKKRNAKGAI